MQPRAWVRTYRAARMRRNIASGPIPLITNHRQLVSISAHLAGPARAQHYCYANRDRRRKLLSTERGFDEPLTVAEDQGRFRHAVGADDCDPKPSHVSPVRRA